MKRSVIVLLAIAFCLPLWEAPAAAATASPGKNSAYASTGLALPGVPAAILTATITKGKKKRVLVVDAMISGICEPFGRVLAYVEVNGIRMEPTGDAYEDCNVRCTLGGQWWIDLDANPSLINVPLDVELFGALTFGGGFFNIFQASMSVRMEKK